MLVNLCNNWSGMSRGNKCWCRKSGILESSRAARDGGSGWGWHMMNPLCYNHWSCVFQWMVGGALHIKGTIPFWGVRIYPVYLYFTPWALLRGGWRRLFWLPKKQRCNPVVNLPVSHWLSWLPRLCSHTICFPTIPAIDKKHGNYLYWVVKMLTQKSLRSSSLALLAAWVIPVYKIPIAISLCLESRCWVPGSCVWHRGFP